jgi:hypothetical protein
MAVLRDIALGSWGVSVFVLLITLWRNWFQTGFDPGEGMPIDCVDQECSTRWKN